MLALATSEEHRPLKKGTIPYREASVAATFFEPAYQRLRLWNNGRFVNLLCFVRESNPAVRCLLDEQGAYRSPSFHAKCFAEVWELPSNNRAAGGPATEECELDKQISKAMGCFDGKYSAAAGTLIWGDVYEESRRRRLVSQLVHESQAKHGSAR
jgi:hypothetical protein